MYLYKHTFCKHHKPWKYKSKACGKQNAHTDFNENAIALSYYFSFLVQLTWIICLSKDVLIRLKEMDQFTAKNFDASPFISVSTRKFYLIS